MPIFLILENKNMKHVIKQRSYVLSNKNNKSSISLDNQTVGT